MAIKYFILGAGGLAKEVHFLAKQSLSVSHKFMGFIDNQPKYSSVLLGRVMLPIIDESFFLEKYRPSSDIYIYHGIGNPSLLWKVSQKFSGFIFPNLIHPNFIGDKNSVQIGSGNIIAAGCVFTVDIKVGSNNIFNLNTTIGHDTKIGDCNIFNPGVKISGGVNIGSRNQFGTNAAILQMLNIGSDNIIGAASLVNKQIHDNNFVLGVPAKTMLR